jgi:polyhydroxyalkanoate synthesis regulator phasin
MLLRGARRAGSAGARGRMAEPADSAASSFRELAGRLLGRDSGSRERARLALDDLVASGKLAQEDAEALIDQLDLQAESGGGVGGKANAALSSLADQLGLVRERRFEELELRVAQLEHRLRLLERGRDAGPPPPAP